MQQLKLMKLSLRNFKGIKDFTLEANGNDVSVYGDNATGKTTIFDAFTWLLFGKDSNNRTDFEIKTLDADNKVIHGLDHEVEGVFRINEKEIALRKVYAEKWTKKRGATTAEFTGHETSYYIDGVPVKKMDYDRQVSEIIDEGVFKLLTNPTYFNEQLNKDKRRDVLIEVCGNVTDSDVIASNQDLSPLPYILGDRSIEDHRKIIAEQRRKINKELDRIPVRIDEVQRSIPDLPNEGEQFIEDSIGEMKEIIERKEGEIARIKAGTALLNKENEIRQLDAELVKMRNEHEKSNYTKIAEKRKEASEVHRQIESLNFEVMKKDRLIKDEQNTIEKNEAIMQSLREEWDRVNKQTFEFDQDSECPTCGQALPEDELRSAREKAEEQFNLKMAGRLEEINSEGKLKKQEVDKAKKKIERLQKRKQGFEKAIREKEDEFIAIENEIARLENVVTDIEDEPSYIKKKQELQSLKEEMHGLRLSKEGEISKVRKEIDELKASIEQLERDKTKFAQARQAEQRIEELKQQERQLASEYERLEYQLHLTEEFTRTKVSLLEEKINSKFKYARFKLFEIQINGGLKEVCETLYKGVPYSKGLNNAARINVGLDIINTLSEHYGFSAPIFIDNREAVTQLIDVNAQVISLIVSENDKTLRIETEEKSIREAF